MDAIVTIVGNGGVGRWNGKLTFDEALRERREWLDQNADWKSAELSMMYLPRLGWVAEIIMFHMIPRIEKMTDSEHEESMKLLRGIL